MGRGWKIGSIGGIPIRLDSSWIWIAVLFTYSRYANVRLGPSAPDHGTAIALALLSAALFFGSVLVHELAHAVTARTLGIPVGGITLVFWGGFTETRAEDRGPIGEFLVSAAGLGFAFLAALFIPRRRDLQPLAPRLGEPASGRRAAARRAFS